MDASQQFCLKWNNYHNHVVNAFESLREDEDFVDVTLACDGKKLQAHKMLLSACSPYFRDLLKGNPCKHPIILLRDVKFKDLQALVEFMYCGQVNVLQDQLGSFLKTAEALQVRGLADSNKKDSDIKNDDDNSNASSPHVPHSGSPSKRLKTHHFKNSESSNDNILPVIPKIEVPEEEEFITNDGNELSQNDPVYDEHKVEKDPTGTDSGDYASCSGDMNYSSPMMDASQYGGDSQDGSSHHHSIVSDPLNDVNQSTSLTPQDTVQGFLSADQSIEDRKYDVGYNRDYQTFGKPFNHLYHPIDKDRFMLWHSFELPIFAEHVKPYLEGRWSGYSTFQIKVMEGKIINQLQDYLDERNLLNSSDKGQQKCHYDALKKAILTKYPNIIQTTDHRQRDNLALLISRLAQKRRRKKFDRRRALEDCKAVNLMPY